MATENKMYIDMGNWNYAWYANADEAYPSIVRGELGVAISTASTRDLILGANSPKPPRVSLKLENGKTRRVFCSPDRVSAVLAGSLQDKTLGGSKIVGASVCG